MVMMGMISRYLNESGTGALVLSDGEIREFTKKDWIDKEWEPGIGQKVLYKSDHNGIEIRTIKDEELEELKSTPEKEEIAAEDERSPNAQFLSLEDTIDHFLNLGYKVATDRDNNGSRIVSMRYYNNNGEFGEAVITLKDSKIEIKETRNGKAV